MVDHRRTPSQRAYQLPGWFFILTAVLSVLGLAAAALVILDVPLTAPGGAASPRPAPSASVAVEPSAEPTVSPTPTGRDQRSGIDVVVLNASKTEGLARSVADTAEKAGWTIAEVGNWVYPAAVNAVYYPEGHQQEAELLAEDVNVTSVRPSRPGMSDDALTVLLVLSP